jgi:hypothetical protein
MHNFKVGNKVLLDGRKVDEDTLEEHGSSGIIGEIYTILEVVDESYLPILLKGGNWHSPNWLTRIVQKNTTDGGLV